MKRYSILLVAALAILTQACKEPEEYGYISDAIYYINTPWTVKQGVAYTSQGLTFDNSTQPISVSILNVRNAATGERAEEFFEKHEIYTWTESPNPLTDTTEYLVNLKGEKVLEPAIRVLERSGQIMLSPLTSKIRPGNYLVDLHVKNPSGERTLKAAMTLLLQEGNPVTYASTPYFNIVTKTKVDKPNIPAGSDSTVAVNYHNIYYNEAEQATGSCRLKITRVADAPNQVELIVTDKNGARYPGNAIRKRPGGSLRTIADYVGMRSMVTDTSIITPFLWTPFPAEYWDGQSNGYMMYYSIYDDQVASADYVEPTSWFPPVEPSYITWNHGPVTLSIRFQFRIFEQGSYLVELQTRSTKKPS